MVGKKACHQLYPLTPYCFCLLLFACDQDTRLNLRNSVGRNIQTQKVYLCFQLIKGTSVAAIVKSYNANLVFPAILLANVFNSGARRCQVWVKKYPYRIVAVSIMLF